MRPPKETVYDLPVLASEIRKWAQKNRMMANFQAEPEYDTGLISNIFSRIGLPAAVSILQDRGIAYIGINDEDGQIVIFLQKRARIKDAQAFDGLIRYGIPISIAYGGLATAGRLPPPPTVAPFIRRDGKYTCGSSVYLSTERGAGTMGCIVKDADGRLYGLSANHVTGGSNYAELTIPISAPGQLDIAAGQPDPFTIGHHYDVMPFKDGLPSIVDCSDNLDAAVFLLGDPSLVTSYQRNSFDTPLKVGSMRSGIEVMKVGRTTGLTRGKVVAKMPEPYPILIEVDVTQGKKLVYLQDLYAIQNPTSKFAASGNSGALIVTAAADENKESIGMVVATDGETLTLALSLDRILDYFKMEIVSGHNV